MTASVFDQHGASAVTGMDHGLTVCGQGDRNVAGEAAVEQPAGVSFRRL